MRKSEMGWDTKGVRRGGAVRGVWSWWPPQQHIERSRESLGSKSGRGAGGRQKTCNVGRDQRI